MITSDGETRFQVGRSHGAEHYTLFRRYYIHGTCPTFHRLIVSIEGKLAGDHDHFFFSLFLLYCSTLIRVSVICIICASHQ